MSNKRKKLDRLDKVCIELSKYNKKYGTNYSYGQYTALIRSGKIKPKRGVDFYE